MNDNPFKPSQAAVYTAQVSCEDHESPSQRLCRVEPRFHCNFLCCDCSATDSKLWKITRSGFVSVGNGTSRLVMPSFVPVFFH